MRSAASSARNDGGMDSSEWRPLCKASWKVRTPTAEVFWSWRSSHRVGRSCRLSTRLNCYVRRRWLCTGHTKHKRSSIRRSTGMTILIVGEGIRPLFLIVVPIKVCRVYTHTAYHMMFKTESHCLQNCIMITRRMNCVTERVHVEGRTTGAG